jgi:hypothetical protein
MATDIDVQRAKHDATIPMWPKAKRDPRTMTFSSARESFTDIKHRPRGEECQGPMLGGAQIGGSS